MPHLSELIGVITALTRNHGDSPHYALDGSSSEELYGDVDLFQHITIDGNLQRSTQPHHAAIFKCFWRGILPFRV